MTNVRGMLRRVQKLEKARQPPPRRPSPIEVAYGSVDAFADAAQAGIDAGKLDRDDMAVVIASVRRWHSDKVWDQWHHTGHRMQERGM